MPEPGAVYPGPLLLYSFSLNLLKAGLLAAPVSPCGAIGGLRVPALDILGPAVPFLAPEAGLGGLTRPFFF